MNGSADSTIWKSRDIISVVRKEESSLSKLRRVPFAPNVIVCGGVREAKVITAKASMWNVVSSAGHCLGNGRAHCVVLKFRGQISMHMHRWVCRSNEMVSTHSSFVRVTVLLTFL